MADHLSQALARLAATDPALVPDAEAVWESLTWGEGIDGIDQETVQRFLWYELPTKWIGPEDLVGRVTAAATALLEALGLERYAAICQSPVTVEVHDAYRTSRKSGLAAYRKADEASGIDPPDLDDFAWGDQMGTEEAVARSAVAGALEGAITAGRFTPGSRGWRFAAQQVAAETLDGSHPEIPGQTRRTAITTERVEWWITSGANRSAQVGLLRSRHAKLTLNPVPPPEGTGGAMEPLTWFLGAVGDGVGLTQAGYLNRPFVVEAVARRGHDADAFPVENPRSEADVFWLRDLDALARQIRAVYRRGRKLSLTKQGRHMAADPSALWRAVATDLAGPNEWNQVVLELAGLLLLDGEVAESDLWPQVAGMTADLGFRFTDAGGAIAPEPRDVDWAAADAVRRMNTFDLIERLGDRPHRRLRLTPIGRTTMLAYLRHRATRPMAGMSG